MIETLLVTKIKSVTPKVYPGKAPESEDGTFVVYRRSQTERETHLSGPSGISYPEFQVDVYSPSYTTMATLSDQLVHLLDGWIEGPIMYCTVENDFDMESDPEEDGYFRHLIQLRFTYRS